MDYVLPDEPRPGALSRFVYPPMWPLLAFMFAGTWLAWPWFLFNSHAMGSPWFRRDAIVVGLGLVGAVAFVLGMGWGIDVEAFGPDAVPYVLLVLVGWKLAIGYALFTSQEGSFELLEAYEEREPPPVPAYVVLLVGVVLKSRLLGAAADALGDWVLLLQ